MPFDQDLSNNILPIASYDAAEEAAKADMGFAEIMAFAPRTFERLGFPVRAKSERELARYADWIRDVGNQEYFKPGRFIRSVSVQTDFTLDEADLITWLCDQVVEISGRRFGRPVRPLCNPFAHLGLFRVVAALKRAYGVGRISVFEVGPGTGYLGAMLAAQGDAYASMDNAQAFYLFQNRLMWQTSRADFAEWGHPDCVGYRKVARVTHLPWWEYLRLFDDCPFAADIVISNTNLSEMTPDALRCVLRISERMLQKSPLGLFLFADMGDPQQNSLQGIDQEFKSLGFRRVFERCFYAYARRDNLPPPLAAVLELRIPLYNPSERAERKGASDIAFVPEGQMPLGMNFVRIVEGWAPPVRKQP